MNAVEIAHRLLCVNTDMQIMPTYKNKPYSLYESDISCKCTYDSKLQLLLLDPALYVTHELSAIYVMVTQQ